tara:strand:- start:3899 stop:5422 length:1524 start_codon:yes stop_codon:yes gene_type:complete
MNRPAWSVEDLSVSFGSQVALNHVSVSGYPNEIVALAGQNGAGKSTLVKALSGVLPHSAYSGEVWIGGSKRRFNSIAEAALAGVTLVPQELAIVPHLTVASNVFLGREPNSFGIIDDEKMEISAEQILSQFGIKINPKQPAGELGIPQQQIVEIARALSQDASVLILDEPTAPLTVTESLLLFDCLKQLAEKGLSIVYITHRLDELRYLAKRVVVLRDGHVEIDSYMEDIDSGDIVTAMIGRSLESLPKQSPKYNSNESVVKLTDWSALPLRSRGPCVTSIDMEVKRGEILGIYGPIGAGRTELLRSIVGAYKGSVSGKLNLQGQEVKFYNPAEALSYGVVYISEDRKTQGIQPYMNVQENITLSKLDAYVGIGGLLDRTKEEKQTKESIKTLGIVAQPKQPITTLSGGNQQKSLLARALMVKPKILLLDEPTQGVDVAAKLEIVKALIKLALSGIAIVMVSSEAEELMSANRILVMRSGKFVAERNPEISSVDELVLIATGANSNL